MTRLLLLLVFLLLTLLIVVTLFPGQVIASGPTQPPTPPTIEISPESIDCESIRFLVKIQSRNHTLSNFQIHYRIGDNPTVIINKTYTLKPPGGVYPSEYRVVIGDLPPATDIHYWAVLQYSDGDITTTEQSARTNLLPEVSVHVYQVYSEGLSLRIEVKPNGNEISAAFCEYYSSASPVWLNVEGEESNPGFYVVSLTDLTPGVSVYYKGVINYLTHLGVRSVQTAEAEIQTNERPELVLRSCRPGFDHVELTMEIRPNSNPIYASWFEYKLHAVSEDWISVAGTEQANNIFSAHISDLSPDQLIYCRLGLSYMTGGEIISKMIQIEPFVTKTFIVLTGDSQSQGDSVNNTVNYTFNGTFRYAKHTVADQTHLDLGFVWSTLANPVLDNKTSKISLGGISLAVGDYDSSYSFSASAVGLKTGIKYFYRAYVVGLDGRAFYGDVRTCLLPAFTPAAATSSAASEATTGHTTLEATTGQTTQQTSFASTAHSSEVVSSDPSKTSQEPTQPSGTSMSSPAETMPEPSDQDDESRTGGVPSILQVILILVVIAVAGCAAWLVFRVRKGKAS